MVVKSTKYVGSFPSMYRKKHWLSFIYVLFTLQLEWENEKMRQRNASKWENYKKTVTELYDCWCRLVRLIASVSAHVQLYSACTCIICTAYEHISCERNKWLYFGLGEQNSCGANWIENYYIHSFSFHFWCYTIEIWMCELTICHCCFSVMLNHEAMCLCVCIERFYENLLPA